MAERKRNEKGQFVKGNQEGHHFPKGEAQRETARQGGIARQAQAKRNKMLKEELREILGEMEINVNLTQSEKPVIMFDDGDDNV